MKEMFDNSVGIFFQKFVLWYINFKINYVYKCVCV